MPTNLQYFTKGKLSFTIHFHFRRTKTISNFLFLINISKFLIFNFLLFFIKMEEEKGVYEVPSGDNSIQEEDSLNEF